MRYPVGYVTIYDDFYGYVSDVWLSFLGTLIFASGDSSIYVEIYFAIFVSHETLEAESRL